ncbi:amino acid transporter [Ahrensia marina]|uniref:Amino acid transporter n=2 Tax=Ahrensia marina TaxID=1514904 RepID=A0A0N0E721_9HYPH|nr:amino acid transporter [Ahrensia marina]
MSAFVSGLLLGAGLIIAIGAQNAFVLRQGLLKTHVFALCLLCASSDALLITLGVLGFGTLIQQSQTALIIVQFAGAAFLFFYGLQALMRALKPQAIEDIAGTGSSLRSVLVTALALTFLNPHVYLDTVVLLGGISTQYAGFDRLWFGAGAVLASFLWFFVLGYGARFLIPIFQKRRSWQILDTLIAIIMWVIAYSLIADFVWG